MKQQSHTLSFVMDASTCRATAADPFCAVPEKPWHLLLALVAVERYLISIKFHHSPNNSSHSHLSAL